MTETVAERVEAISALFPQLIELYPLELFLARLLASLEQLVGAAPVGCLVLPGGHLAARSADRFEVEPVGADALAAANEASRPIPSRTLGSGAAARILSESATVRLLPCTILERALGFLVVPGSARKEPASLRLLARLAGYYLHRHEIEARILARFRRDLVIMGCSPSIFELQEEMERVAKLSEPILILGESGSGKEIFAKAVHVLSRREGGAFVAVNCAAAPSENLLLDEFFGHRRGAFTGAAYDREGCCQQASGGTLFLDEIGDMSHELQTLLLRTLTTGEVRRIGDTRSTQVDFRLVSATHRDLHQAEARRQFRSDLFFRISPFQLRIPPLRERPSDIAFLAGYILFRFASDNGLAPKELAPSALRSLEAHSWPGNVRELENVLKRAFVRAGAAIEAGDLRFDGRKTEETMGPERLLREIREGGRCFWDALAGPFMRRELTHADVARVLEGELREAGGRLKRVAARLNVPAGDYGRFVAFLHRHGFRKPARS